MEEIDLKDANLTKRESKPQILTVKHIERILVMDTFRDRVQGLAENGRGIRLSCDEIGFSVSVSYYRSQFQNREQCLVLLAEYLRLLPDLVQLALVEKYPIK